MAIYGLNRIMAHLPETSFCVIGIALLCMNLAKSLRGLLLALAEMWMGWYDREQSEKFRLVTEWTLFIVSKFWRVAQRPPSPENLQWVRQGTRKRTDGETGSAADRPAGS